MEVRYSVRQAADKTGVKPYVLRYWEDELELKIHRNEMGHRYYTAYDIQLFLNIKELKEKGLQLRAIKELLPDVMFKEVLKTNVEKQEPEEDSIVMEAEKREKDDEKILEFQAILERLILRELSARDEEEEKCRSLDLAIRRQQMVRKEAAATNEKKNMRKRI